MLRTANSVTAVGLAGMHLSGLLARVVEAGERTEPLSVRLLCRDPDDRDGWRYVYHLRESRVVSDDEFEDLLAEDRMMHTRVSRVVERLNRRSTFHGEIAVEGLTDSATIRRTR